MEEVGRIKHAIKTICIYNESFVNVGRFIFFFFLMI